MKAEQTVIRIGRLLESSDAFIMEAEIDALVSRLARCFPSLPPEAKTDAIMLGHSLSKLRNKIKVLQDKNAKRKGPSFSVAQQLIA